MKFLFILLLTFINLLHAKAQVPDTITLRPAAVYYNQKWEVTKKEKAFYTRVAYFPDSLHRISNLGSHAFDKQVTDYYSNGAVLSRGFYDKGRRLGQWVFYYDNGQKEGQGWFDGKYKTGKWEYWRQNGQPLYIFESVPGENKAKLQTYWNNKGEQVITNGNGTFSEMLLNEDGQMLLVGSYKNGLKDGTWTYSHQNGEAVLQQKFVKGDRVETIRFDKGKRVNRGISLSPPIEIEPDFAYLNRVEAWFRDPAAFKSGYPLVAHVLGFTVTERTLTHSRGVETVYFGISDKKNPTADTVTYGRPFTAEEMPTYPKGSEKMEAFLRKHLWGVRDHSPSGLVVVSFDIDSEGNHSNYKLVKGLHPKVDEEVMRVIKLMPRWIPGKAQKEGTPFNYVLPVKF